MNDAPAIITDRIKVDNIITGVKAEDDYQKWHIMADAGDVMELSVGWSEGSGYYAYGFDFPVVEVSQEEGTV